jgi:S1-C subfamily serine protease
VETQAPAAVGPTEPRGYSDFVRAPVFAVAAVAAVLGAGVALALGSLVGASEGSTTTVVVQSTLTETAAPSTAVPALGNRFDPAAIYAHRAPGVVTLYADLGADGQAQGSGFVVDGNGTILTNAHVVTNVAERSGGAVKGAEKLYVEFRDGDRVPATIIGWDLFSDVAAVRVDPAGHALAPVPLGHSSTVVVGTPVAAIGSPFGEQSSLSVGVVSATDRTIDSLTSGYSVADAIQIDAPINRGNSGGPLFDARGRVIGINAQIRSASGNAEGVGFAIPIDTAKRALDQLLRTGKVAYAYVGVTTQDVTPGLARKFGLDSPRGPDREGRARDAGVSRRAARWHAYGRLQRPRGLARRRRDRRHRWHAGRRSGRRLAGGGEARGGPAGHVHGAQRRHRPASGEGDARRAPGLAVYGSRRPARLPAPVR